MDELFGISVARPGKLDPWYTYGAMVPSIPCWATGTALGVLAGSALPASVVSALSVALYGMFLAIIIPPARKNRVVAGVVAISFAASYAAGKLPLVSDISSGSRTILLTLIISATAITGVMARPGGWLLHGLFAKETGAIQMLLPAVKPWMDLARVALLYGTGMAVVLLPVNTAARMEQFRPKWWQAAALAVLTAWSVLSFTGITTFIYSNF